MKTLNGQIEYINKAILVHCYFTTGFIVNTEYAESKEEAHKILKEQLTLVVEELREDLINYDYNIQFSDNPVYPFIRSNPDKNNNIPINTYMEEQGLVGELLFGNSIFVESGDIAEGKEKLLLDIKNHVKEVYAYLIDDACIIIEEGEE